METILFFGGTIVLFVGVILIGKYVLPKLNKAREVKK
jgi:hypothetical protein